MPSIQTKSNKLPRVLAEADGRPPQTASVWGDSSDEDSSVPH